MFFRNSPPDCFGGYVQLDFICCLWGKTLVFPHTPLALFTFNCASVRRVAVLRTEYPHFVRRFRLTATRALPSTRKGDASPLTPD